LKAFLKSRKQKEMRAFYSSGYDDVRRV